MPFGIPAFPRDPVTGETVGIAQSILGNKKKDSKKDSNKDSKKDPKKDAASTIASWKEKEAAGDARPSTDTLPQYSERSSSK